MRSAKTLMILALFCSQAFAFRTAVFGPELKGQTTSFEKQTAFFAAETPEDAKRPIWILAGDSIATAFGSGSTLTERLGEANSNELPAAGSGFDTPQFRPSSDFSWYAGLKVNDHFLSRLQLHSQRSWIIVATAVAGARNTSREHKPFTLIKKVEQAERVELITLSLGGNDLCDRGLTRSELAELKANVEASKKKFKNARWVVAKVPNFKAVYESILGALDQQAPQVGRERLKNYCIDSWLKQNCPALRSRPATIEAEINDYNRLLESLFGNLADLESQVVKDLGALDFMAGDCFHPSRLAQPYIAKALFESLKQ